MGGYVGRVLCPYRVRRLLDTQRSADVGAFDSGRHRAPDSRIRHMIFLRTTTMLKTEIHKLASRHKDGAPMFVGSYQLLWCLVGSVWHLVGMKPTTELS